MLMIPLCDVGARCAHAHMRTRTPWLWLGLSVSLAGRKETTHTLQTSHEIQRISLNYALWRVRRPVVSGEQGGIGPYVGPHELAGRFRPLP